jgi:hypothetical protein
MFAWRGSGVVTHVPGFWSEKGVRVTVRVVMMMDCMYI